jgi:acetylornithine deacetylase
MQPAQVRDSLRERIAQTLRGSELRWELEPLMVAVPPWQSAADAGIVRAAEEVTGAAARSVMFATEAPYFGQLGMQAVLLGPGDIRHAHAVDEQTSTVALHRSVGQLAALVERRCGRR